MVFEEYDIEIDKDDFTRSLVTNSNRNRHF